MPLGVWAQQVIPIVNLPSHNNRLRAPSFGRRRSTGVSGVRGTHTYMSAFEKRVFAHLCARACSKRRQRRLRVQRRGHGAKRRHVHGERSGQVQGLARARSMQHMSRQLCVAYRYIRACFRRTCCMINAYSMPMLRRRTCSINIYDVEQTPYHRYLSSPWPLVLLAMLH